VELLTAGYTHRNQPSSIDLNAVRLCFQVFLEGPQKGKFTVPLKPVVSEPIYDKKSMSDLVITKLSHCNAFCNGGQEMILLCEKVISRELLLLDMKMIFGFWTLFDCRLRKKTFKFVSTMKIITTHGRAMANFNTHRLVEKIFPGFLNS
jgi:hypothetical protein